MLLTTLVVQVQQMVVFNVFLLCVVGFPKPGSFYKTGFSVLQVKRSKPVFGFGFGSHVIAFTANRRGGGLQAAALLTELLLTLSRRSKRAFNLPPCLPGTEQVTALKILGVAITGKLSRAYT